MTFFCVHRWQEALTVYPRTNKQNQKKKRKVDPPTHQVHRHLYAPHTARRFTFHPLGFYSLKNIGEIRSHGRTALSHFSTPVFARSMFCCSRSDQEIRWALLNHRRVALLCYCCKRQRKNKYTHMPWKYAAWRLFIPCTALTVFPSDSEMLSSCQLHNPC